MTTEFKKFQTVVFFTLLGIIILLFGWMIMPYVYPLFWATVIAIIFRPVYNWLKKKTKNPRLSAGLTVVLVILVVIIPLSAILSIVIQQALDAYQLLSKPSTIANIQNTIDSLLSSPRIQQLSIRLDLYGKLKTASDNIASLGVAWLTVSSKNTITAVVQFIVMLYSSYYFLKDGERWLARLLYLLPIQKENEEILTRRFVSTTKATLKGSVLIGFIQGVFAGVLFTLAGIPAAAFWGLLMIIAAIIPGVGTAIIWVPTTIVLFVTHQWIPAVMVLIGGLIMGAIDNFVRPPLVGKDSQLHPLVVLCSTIGGIGVFGISGVVIGPIIAGFLMSVLSMYEQRYKSQL